jgi:hypothetical protein
MKTTPIRVIRLGRAAESEWLRAHGFDGLYTPNDDCGCFLGDLYPCGERGDRVACVPGHESDAGIHAPRRKSHV